MKKAKMSLRSIKLVGDDFNKATIHNSRDESDKNSPSLTNRSDPDKLYLNKHWANPNYSHITNSEQLWTFIKEDFHKAKQKGKTTRKRFIPRMSNRRGYKPVETSLVREIVLQIGKEKDEQLVPIKVYSEFFSWFTKHFPGDVLRIDMHNDESCRHIHILVTTWSLEHSQNYTKNNLIDQYKLFQRKAYKALKEITKKYGIDLIAPIPKVESGVDHLAPNVYDRYGLEIEDCKKYLDELRWEITEGKKLRKKLQHENSYLQAENSELLIKHGALWGEVNRLKYELNEILEYFQELFLDDLRKLSKKFLKEKWAKLELATYENIQSVGLEILQDEDEEIITILKKQ